MNLPEVIDRYLVTWQHFAPGALNFDPHVAVVRLYHQVARLDLIFGASVLHREPLGSAFESPGTCWLGGSVVGIPSQVRAGFRLAGRPETLVVSHNLSK